jgi:acetyltransferase-like isoleucine patch superfamily enzyme
MFIHEKAIVETNTKIGARSRIWAFAHVLNGAAIGVDCNICDGVFIEGNVIVGDRVTIKCGVQLWDGVRIEDDVFIGPNATFTNDRYPRSRKYLKNYPLTTIRRGATIGANATVLPGIEIGADAMVAAGAVVTKNVPANALIMGNPARLQGWICHCGEKITVSGKLISSCSCGRGYRLDECGVLEFIQHKT